MEYICEAIDEALPHDYEGTGREIYLLGFERYQTAHFEREMKRARRELEAAMPLLVRPESVPKFSDADELP